MRVKLLVLVALGALLGTMFVGSSTGVASAAPADYIDGLIESAAPGGSVTIPANTPSTALVKQIVRVTANKCDANGTPLYVIAGNFSVYVKGIDVVGTCIVFSGFTITGWTDDGFRVGIVENANGTVQRSSKIALLYSVVDGAPAPDCPAPDTGKGVHINSSATSINDAGKWSTDITIATSTIKNAPVDNIAVYGGKNITIASNTIQTPKLNLTSPCTVDREHNDDIQLQRVQNVTIDNNTISDNPSAVYATAPDQAIIASDGTTGGVESGLIVTNNKIQNYKRGQIPVNFSGPGVQVTQYRNNRICNSHATTTGTGYKFAAGAVLADLTPTGNSFSTTCP